MGSALAVLLFAALAAGCGLGVLGTVAQPKVGQAKGLRREPDPFLVEAGNADLDRSGVA